MTEPRKPLDWYFAQVYPYTVVPDDESWFIEFPDLLGCMTQVEDVGEIVGAAEEIRILWIEGEYEDGATIPEPSTDADYSGRFVVRLSKRLHRDLAQQAKQEGVSLNSHVASLLAERNMTVQVLARLDVSETAGRRPTEPEAKRKAAVGE